MSNFKLLTSKVELEAFTILNPKKYPELASEWMPILAARASKNNDELTGKDPERDEKLLKFLAKHNHTSPFEHLSATFKVSCPLFVRSEWHRHRTQSYNEASMRYTDSFVGEFNLPDEFRGQGTGNLQSGDGVLDAVTDAEAKRVVQSFYQFSLDTYKALLAAGVAREHARMVLPTGHMTHFYATANLLNWARFCKLRCATAAQKEIRDLAIAVDEELEALYPTPWKYLKEYVINDN